MIYKRVPGKEYSSGHAREPRGALFQFTVSASTRYSSWEVYGKAQEALAKDEAFAKLYARTATFAELTGRNIAVGIDL
jgi:hypothetical protein